MVIAMRRTSEGNGSLILAKQVLSSDNSLNAKLVSLISTKQTASEDSFDDLIIENAQENLTPLHSLSLFTAKRKMWKANNDLLSLPLLLAKKQEIQSKLEIQKYTGRSTSHTKRKLNQIYSEISRRLSISLAIVTFTIMGAAFGCQIGRLHARRRFVSVVFLAGGFLVAFLAAKGVEDKALLASLLYLVPHAIIVIASIIRLQRIQKGVE